MKLKRTKVYLGEVNFQNGAVVIDGIVMPLDKVSIQVKQSDKEKDTLVVVARRRRWPFGRVPKQPIFTTEEIPEGFGMGT